MTVDAQSFKQAMRHCAGAVALADRRRRYARPLVLTAAVVVVASSGDLILPLTGRGGAAATGRRNRLLAGR